PEGIVVDGYFGGFRTAEPLVIHIETASEAVALVVHGGRFQAISSFGEDFTGDLGMDIIVDRKVIPKVSQEEAACLLFSIGRKDDAAALFVRCVRDDAKGQAQRSGDIVEIKVKRPRNDLVTSYGFDFIGRNVPMGLYQVTGGIEGMAEVHIVISVFFDGLPP